jgi:hypothetical protein
MAQSPRANKKKNSTRKNERRGKIFQNAIKATRSNTAKRLREQELEQENAVQEHSSLFAVSPRSFLKQAGEKNATLEEEEAHLINMGSLSVLDFEE